MRTHGSVDIFILCDASRGNNGQDVFIPCYHISGSNAMWRGWRHTICGEFTGTHSMEFHYGITKPNKCTFQYTHIISADEPDSRVPYHMGVWNPCRPLHDIFVSMPSIRNRCWNGDASNMMMSTSSGWLWLHEALCISPKRWMNIYGFHSKCQ